MPSEVSASANRTYHEAQSQMELLPNYYNWIYSVFLRHINGKVLELGCGAGLGIHTYVDHVEGVCAVDFNEELLSRVREAFPQKQVRTIQADLLGSWDELNGVAADTIIMMDLLEHFEDDRNLLMKVRSLLAPGGRLCIKVPAQSELFSEMDRASGHYRRYDPQHIESLASNLGLRILQMEYLNQIGALAYRMKRRKKTNFSKSFSSSQLKAINFLLPIIATADRVQLFPGLSLTVVLEAPDSSAVTSP